MAHIVDKNSPVILGADGHPAVRPGRRVRATYDAAEIGGYETRKHWAKADGLSPVAANSPEVRRLLRNRSRYEVFNNSYAKGILQTFVCDLIGTGPRPQMLSKDEDANEKVEREFGKWARAVNLAGKLRTMRLSKAVDGESFAVLTTRKSVNHPVKLDLRLVEAEQVTTPDMGMLKENVDDGVVLDEFGEPSMYHILRRHPGSMGISAGDQYDSIEASKVLHHFRVDRPGQLRGLPEIMPALPLFAQLRRYTLATVAAAETAADVAGVVYTEAPADPDLEENPGAYDEIEIPQRALLTMPWGHRMEQIDAKQPTTTYGDFVERLLNEIARCLCMPLNIAMCNSAGYNYSSGRLDHQTYFKFVRVEQDDEEICVVDRIFQAWLDEAVLISGLLTQSMRSLDADLSHEWFWDGFEEIDETKSAEAATKRLANGTSNYAREYARTGRDWRAGTLQRAREEQFFKDNGLSFNLSGSGQSAQPADQPEADHVEK